MSTEWKLERFRRHLRSRRSTQIKAGGQAAVCIIPPLFFALSALLSCIQPSEEDPAGFWTGDARGTEDSATPDPEPDAARDAPLGEDAERSVPAFPERDPRGACERYRLVDRLARLPASLTEVSGVVADPRDDRLLWVHEDSGSPPVVHAVRDGVLLATLTLDGVVATDFEDLALARCDARWCLYVGDIGDNDAERTSIAVHRLVLPDDLQDARVSVETLELVWPDEPTNAEALIVYEGRVVVFGKAPGALRVGSASFSEGRATLEDQGSVDIGAWRRGVRVTAADYLPAGARDAGLLLLRYGSGVWEIQTDDPRELAALAEDAAALDARLRELPAETEPQGEAIAWTAGGYVHVSEGDAPLIHRFECDDAP